jgi:hypothetical protein
VQQVSEEVQAVPTPRQSPHVLAALDRHTRGAQQVEVPVPEDVHPCVVVLQHFPPTHESLTQSELSMQLLPAAWRVPGWHCEFTQRMPPQQSTLVVHVAAKPPHAQVPFKHLYPLQQSRSTSHAPLESTHPLWQNPRTQLEPEQHSPSVAQACDSVRHGLEHVPWGHPSWLQHSLESVHAMPCDLQGGGTLQAPLMHESPEQHPPVVQAWFSPMHVGSAMHVPFEQMLLLQHS